MWTYSSLLHVTAAVFTGKLGWIVAPIWAAFTGVGFALQAPAAEFISCCGFVFSKHLYDVGDTIKLNDGKDGKDGPKLTVRRMYLTYTEFWQVDTGILVEIQHTELLKMNISNLTRSKCRSIPILPITIDANTTMNDERIKAIEKELQDFVMYGGRCRYTKAVSLESLWMDNGQKKQLHIKIDFKEYVSILPYM
jgi:hypothetical protein